MIRLTKTKLTIMLTFDIFKLYPDGEIFDEGVLPNSPDGLFMTESSGRLKWIAKKGCGNDWAIYCHRPDKSSDWIAQHGDKVRYEDNIRRCVSCEDSVFNLYRH
ncbi:hypothetical protein LCGC14_1687620 [marine sediment metagenome]|uniref:Uncharacterized protein n=1 Tax=marine sediment metagenome TaxID=412755 RepID=A0A0F9HLV8_9ZZZZ